MATSKPVRGGRPRKAADRADRTLSVRLGAADWQRLHAIVSQQRLALQRAGVVPEAAERVGAADVIRGLLRAAARDAGLGKP